MPRKVFDKYQDRMELKVTRIKEDYRADIAALIGRINNLERIVEERLNQPDKHTCRDPTCKFCSEEDDNDYELLDSP